MLVFCLILASKNRQSNTRAGRAVLLKKRCIQVPTYTDKQEKMKKRIFLFTLFLVQMFFCVGTLKGQYIPLVEESKYWIYYDFQARPRPTTGFLITIQDDTVIQNKAYKKVYKYELTGVVKNLANNEPPQFVADFPYTIKDKTLVSFLREDIQTKQIYNLPASPDSCVDSSSGIINPCNAIVFCDTVEHLLFDFSLETNDTLNYCCFAPLHYNWEIQPEKVDSIKPEVHFGKLRNTFYTYGVNSYLPNLMSPGPIGASPVKIVEGVGFLNQGIFHYRFGMLVDYCEGDADFCDIIASTKDQAFQKNQVTVYPNPATDYLNFEGIGGIGEISLINAHGMVVVHVSHEKRLDVRGLTAGLYLCRITLDNGIFIHKKIIKLQP